MGLALHLDNFSLRVQRSSNLKDLRCRNEINRSVCHFFKKLVGIIKNSFQIFESSWFFKCGLDLIKA